MTTVDSGGSYGQSAYLHTQLDTELGGGREYGNLYREDHSITPHSNPVGSVTGSGGSGGEYYAGAANYIMGDNYG
jgi:hypothetical protein